LGETDPEKQLNEAGCSDAQPVSRYFTPISLCEAGETALFGPSSFPGKSQSQELTTCILANGCFFLPLVSLSWL